MPRSGGTLLYQLVSEIAEAGGIAQGRGFAREGIRRGVVKSEECCQWMLDRRPLAFGTYRDFRDIIVSLRDFYNRRSVVKGSIARWTVAEVVRDEGQKILDDYYCWRSVCDVWFRYENNLVDRILEIVPAHLGVTLPLADLKAIKREYSLIRNIKRTQSQPRWIDTDTMLTQAHISETAGRSTWREELTQDEVNLIEELAGDWLIDHNYELSPTGKK